MNVDAIMSSNKAPDNTLTTSVGLDTKHESMDADFDNGSSTSANDLVSPLTLDYAAPPTDGNTREHRRGDEDEDDSEDETFVFRDMEEHAEKQNTAGPLETMNQDNHEKDSTQFATKTAVYDDDEHQGTAYHHHHHHHHHRVISQLASQVSDPEELCIDDRRLFRAVRDAGEYSSGILACEVWLLNEDDELVRPNGGWWHNSKLHQSQVSSRLQKLEATMPPPVQPGVDVPGILWSETAERHDRDIGIVHRSDSLSVGHRSTENLKDMHPHSHQHHNYNHSMTPSGPSIEGLLHLSFHHNPPALFWRDLKSIIEEPDLPKTDRIQQLVAAGLGRATGVPFHVRTQQGLVIYYARSLASGSLIENVANDAYLRAAAEMVGHVAALSEVRRASIEARRRSKREIFNRFCKNMMEYQKDMSQITDESLKEFLFGIRDIETLPKYADKVEGPILMDDVPPRSTRTMERVHQVLRGWLHKCKGGNLQVPPAMTFRQSLWTIFGAFCGLLVLSPLNEFYKILSDNDYFLLIGPFGALMTLQYGLPAAAASQPRNVVLGQAVAGAVSLAFTYIPESILPVWLRRAIGPAVAIGVMVKCGVTHPPAGAHAVLFASGRYNFGFYALVVLSSAISVIPATLVNNMSAKRQYPTYWAALHLPFDLGRIKEGK